MDDPGTLADWFARRMPGGSYVGHPVVRCDRDEIVVIGTIAPAGGGDGDDEAAVHRQVRLHRELTRAERMAIAQEAEARFGRKVSWGVQCAGIEFLFSTVSVPVMTRLRLAERNVLDVLIAAGVARSRSEALAWCVRLVGQHEADWIDELREVLGELDRLRAAGPQAPEA